MRSTHCDLLKVLAGISAALLGQEKKGRGGRAERLWPRFKQS